MEGDESAGKDAVSFEPFIGIAPRRYLELFEALGRKVIKPVYAASLGRGIPSVFTPRVVLMRALGRSRFTDDGR